MKREVQVQEYIKPVVYRLMAAQPLIYKSHTQDKDFIIYLH
jgi:hypothetical protein